MSRRDYIKLNRRKTKPGSEAKAGDRVLLPATLDLGTVVSVSPDPFIPTAEVQFDNGKVGHFVPLGNLFVLMEAWRPTQHLLEATAQYAETIDDVLDGLLRKLLVIEALDILQDVEFDEDSGSVYLFFDPSLPGDEIMEVVEVLKSEHKEIGLVASPDGSLEGEQAACDWWVAYLPRTKQEGIAPPPPDPSVYSSEEEPPGPQLRQDIVVRAPQGSAEQVADEIDIDSLFGDFGGTTEALRRLPARIQEQVARRMRAGR